MIWVFPIVMVAVFVAIGIAALIMFRNIDDRYK